MRKLDASLSEILRAGLQELQLTLTDKQVDLLMAYHALLLKWNKAYNLSAVRDPEDMIRLHLLDSLSVASFISGERILDVGTGAGLPGIPLAIVFPSRHFTLLDSAGKKTRFLVQVQQSLSLNNVEVENRRVENYHPEGLFDGIISRAFASLSDMTSHCKHLLGQDGAFWAMKGIYPKDELSEIEKHYRVDAYYELCVPGLEAQRCLIRLVSTTTPIQHETEE